MQSDTNQLKEESLNRANEIVQEYFPLFHIASVLSSYPDESALVEIKKIIDDLHLEEQAVHISDTDWRIIKNFLGALNPEKLQTLQSDYIKIFDIGKSVNPLYETEYGRNRILSKGTELADIAGFYKAFGLELTHSDMQDHISMELEFYFHLLLKQAFCAENQDSDGSEIVYNARKSFMESHLGRFGKCIAERLDVRENEYFSSIFNWISMLVEIECLAIDVQPEKLTWTGEPLKEEMNCCG
jgi:nitrate reductase assembly molybdenum cofactor insertion protein NarJ